MILMLPKAIEEINRLEAEIERLNAVILALSADLEQHKVNAVEELAGYKDENKRLWDNRAEMKAAAERNAKQVAGIEIFQFLKEVAHAYRFLEYYRALIEQPGDRAVFDETLEVVRRKISSHVVPTVLIGNQGCVKSGFQTVDGVVLLHEIYE